MHRLALSIVALLFCTPAVAQVAFVVAPEQSSGLSFAQSVPEAIEFATEECVYTGVERGFSEAEMREYCELETVCARGDWAVMVSVWGELHWSELYCGLPNEAAARAVGDAICGVERPGVPGCDVTQIFDRGRQLLP